MYMNREIGRLSVGRIQVSDVLLDSKITVVIQKMFNTEGS
jgi:hypothetical protein